MKYKEYLEAQGYSKSTIEHYQERLTIFINWLKKENIKAKEIDYKTSLQYIKYLQTKQLKVQTINNHIASLKSYFNYLISERERINNPLEEVQVKGTVKKVLHNLLDADELEDLYYSYETETFNKYSNYKTKLSAKRNKIIVGFIVYQGLNTTNLKSLQLEHLQVRKGKLYVPSTKRSNAREIELKSWQVVDLLEYINEVRPQIAKYNDIYNENLFIPQQHFNDLLQRGILKRLKKINHKVTSVNHLRASVIVNWLGQYNIRKVQYLAGHRYISSTEKYRQDNLESLQEAINQFHPLS
ncbi:tyrosine-type recombinase/integrase [Tenacibaculum amylolyticum]|uniref:tyrosine-type recombinase/integrase n=1 Tax=Tenacibaculum amylolyticum TaxID=104269 RepID=UPI00389499B1